MGFSGLCSRFIGEFLQTLGGASSHHQNQDQETRFSEHDNNARKFDDSMTHALITVFGMQSNGRIKKRKAQNVVEKLGLEYRKEDDYYDDDEVEVAVDEVIGGGEEGFKSNELLVEAFKIFDIDGDGFIEANELKRVLECLGLDNGWEISEIEKMVRIFDVNLDGKVDFSEFELMMGVKCT